MNFEDIKTPEFQEMLRNASNPEELLGLAKEAGFELSDEQLEAVSGGTGAAGTSRAARTSARNTTPSGCTSAGGTSAKRSRVCDALPVGKPRIARLTVSR